MNVPIEDIIERLDRIEKYLSSLQSSIPVSVPRDECGIDETAEVTELQRSTIYRLSSQGAIPCQRRGRMLLFSRKALITWNNDRTIEKRNPEEVAAEELATSVRRRGK